MMQKQEIKDYDKKRNFISEIYEDNRVDALCENDAKLYKDYAEELAHANDLVGLEVIAYGCYCGNKAFEIDYKRAEECLLKLIQLECNAFHANTLGYIYYYGRTTDGEPDYDKAFKYYSLAAIDGVHESMYKVSDMLMKGRGVEKNIVYAKYIIENLYDDTLEMFCNKQYDCKFADVALRMGSIIEYEFDNTLEGCKEYCYEDAFHYYLQAKFAIENRMETTDYVGDESVLCHINKAIENIKDKISIEEIDKGYKPINLEAFFDLCVHYKGHLQLNISQDNNGVYKLEFTCTKYLEECGFPVDLVPADFFVTIDDIAYCNFVSSIVVETEKDATVLIDDEQIYWSKESARRFSVNTLYDEDTLVATNQYHDGCKIEIKGKYTLRFEE